MEELANLNSVLWFFIGVLACRFVSRLIDISHAAMLVTEAVNATLLMLAKLHEDMAFVMELKRKHMHASDISPERIRDFEKMDERAIEDWKSMVISNMISRAPSSFGTFLRFSNWREAMAHINEIQKRK